MLQQVRIVGVQQPLPESVMWSPRLKYDINVLKTCRRFTRNLSAFRGLSYDKRLNMLIVDNIVSNSTTRTNTGTCQSEFARLLRPPFLASHDSCKTKCCSTCTTCSCLVRCWSHHQRTRQSYNMLYNMFVCSFV